MEAFGGLVVLVLIICIIIYCVKKKKKNKVIQEETKNQELIAEKEKKQSELEKLKKKWDEKIEEFENYGLPTVETDSLNLAKNETCHFLGKANFCKLKQSVVGYEGGSRGVSVRLIKGLSVRVGNFKGHNIKETIIEKTNGTIYLTSTKIIFSAISNARVIKYNSILNMTVIDNMLQIQTDDRTHLFQVDDWINFFAILQCLIDKAKN